jgi:hypothetical protein
VKLTISYDDAMHDAFSGHPVFEVTIADAEAVESVDPLITAIKGFVEPFELPEVSMRLSALSGSGRADLSGFKRREAVQEAIAMALDPRHWAKEQQADRPSD